VIVLVLIALLWIAVLVPMVVAKLRERRSALAIGEFHHRLDLLERTGPKLVEPAYRLASSDGGPAVDPIVVAAPPPVHRPSLRLVPPPGAAAPQVPTVARTRPSAADRDEVTEPSFALVELECRRLERLIRRSVARRRRRDIFAGLCGFGSLTGLLGMAPSLRGAWYVLAIDVCVLVGFLGLAAYGQRIEAEKDHLEALAHAAETEATWVPILEPDQATTAGRQHSTIWPLAAEA